MSNKKKLVLSLAFAVVVFGLSFLTKKEVDDTYISLGDAFVMLAACFLPTGWAMLTALLGCGIAAFLIGNWQALIAVALFRVLAACWFMDDEKKLLTSRTMIGVVMSFVLFSVGPFLLDMILTKGDSIPFHLLGAPALGAVANVVLFLGLALLIDKFRIKEKIQK